MKSPNLILTGFKHKKTCCIYCDFTLVHFEKPYISSVLHFFKVPYTGKHAENLLCHLNPKFSWKCPKKNQLNKKLCCFGICGCSVCESTRGVAEKCRTHDHLTINIVSSSPATASMFVSLGKVYISICFVVHLVPVSCGKYYNLSADRAYTWPVANRPIKVKWLWWFPDGVII